MTKRVNAIIWIPRLQSCLVKTMTKSSARGADCIWSHVRNKTPGRSCLYLQWASLSDHRGRVYVNSLLITAASIKHLQITALCACDVIYVAQSKHCRFFLFTYNEELPLMSRRWSETGQEQKKKKKNVQEKQNPQKNECEKSESERRVLTTWEFLGDFK